VVRHGIAVGNGRVFVICEDGRALCLK